MFKVHSDNALERISQIETINLSSLTFLRVNFATSSS